MLLYNTVGKLEGEILIETGSISKKINGIITLDFTTIFGNEISSEIVPASIIEAENCYFRVQKINRTNSAQRKISVSCECKISIDLLDKYVESYKVTDATFQLAINQLLSGEGYTIEVASNLTAIKSYEATKTNKYKILQDLIELYSVEMLVKKNTITFAKAIGNQIPIVFLMGKNLENFQSYEDISQVVTRLHYESSSNEELKGVMDSQYINNYPTIKETYQSFDADTAEALDILASNYLKSVELPETSYKVDLPLQYQLEDVEVLRKVDTGDVVEITDFDGATKTTRVMELSKDITCQSNIAVTLGFIPKELTDLQTNILSRIENLENKKQAVDINYITQVLETKVISAETAHILNAWIRNLNVEYLETNFEAIDVRVSNESNKRYFIRIKGIEMVFMEAELSAAETQNYLDADGNQIYWTAIDSHAQAYKFFTITDPYEVHQADLKDLSQSEIEQFRERFRVKVRKTLNEYEKMKINFDATGDTIYPKMVWGTGDGNANNKKGFIYKDTDGFVVEYYNSTGQLRQMKMTEEGITFTPEIAGGGSKEEVIVNEDGSVVVGKHYIIDHQPTQAEIDTLEEGTIIIVYDSKAEYVPTA